MANNPQLKINQLAKDLGKKSKDIVELLTGKGIDVRIRKRHLGPMSLIYSLRLLPRKIR